MKIKIYGEEDDDKVTRLKLVNSRGNVEVAAVNKDGKIDGAGWLIRFNSDGTIYRNCSVDDKFGFKLDSIGKIRLGEGD